MKGRTDDLLEKWCLSRNRKLHMKLVRKTRSGCKNTRGQTSARDDVLPIQESPQRKTKWEFTAVRNTVKTSKSNLAGTTLPRDGRDRSCKLQFPPILQQIKPYQYLFRERKRAMRHLEGRMASSNPNLEVGLKPTRTRRDGLEKRRDPHEA